jgi:chromosome segregation ATPase
MTGLAELDKRVTTLERGMDDVRKLASGASEESGDVHVRLLGHTKTLEALRETQLEQGQQIDGLRTDVRHLQSEVGEGLAEMRHHFERTAEFRGEIRGRISDVRGDTCEMRERLALFESEVRHGFSMVGDGMAEIRALLLSQARRADPPSKP